MESRETHAPMTSAMSVASDNIRPAPLDSSQEELGGSDVRKIDIVHIDSDPLWCEAIAKLVTTRPGVRRFSQAMSAATGLVLCREHGPSIIILELQLSDLDGYALIARIRLAWPQTRIIFLTGRTDDFTMYQVSMGVARGFVVKNTAFRLFLDRALSAVGEGRSYLCEAGMELMRRFRCNPSGFQKILSAHEISLLSNFAGGASDIEIAAERHLSRHTVHAHRTRIMAKLGVHGTQELVRWAARAGFRPTA